MTCRASSLGKLPTIKFNNKMEDEFIIMKTLTINIDSNYQDPLTPMQQIEFANRTAEAFNESSESMTITTSSDIFIRQINICICVFSCGECGENEKIRGLPKLNYKQVQAFEDGKEVEVCSLGVDSPYLNKIIDIQNEMADIVAQEVKYGR